LKCFSLNELARSYGLVESPDGRVSTQMLRKRLAVAIDEPAVIHGHLFPHAFDKHYVERVVVLRCDPTVLKGRLRARGYPSRQVVDNLEAELIGLVSSEAFEAFGPTATFEVDTTHSTPVEAASSALKVIEGDAEPAPRIDWMANYDSGRKLRSLLSVA